MTAKIVVLDYDPDWARRFEALKATLEPVLSKLEHRIEHVGSTSVPGLAAKPIIDMVVIVPSQAEISSAIEQLASLGYVHRGDLGISGREAFRAPPGRPAHHLYLCVVGNHSLQNQLTLRDYLGQHPAAREQYAQLKKGLAERFSDDIEAYVEGKTAFIVSILRQAGFAPEILEQIIEANKKPR